MKILAWPFMASVLALSGCSQATETPASVGIAPSSSVSAKADAASWTVNQDSSHVRFTASQQDKDFTGQFNSFDAIINFAPEAVEAASVKATIDLGSVSAGDKDRDGALPGKEWFSVKKFPVAVFESDNFVKISDNNYEARGTLTMKGKSQPLTLPFTLNIADGTANMTGNVTLDRRLWEVGTGSWATDEWVSTEVSVDVKVSAKRR